jgi:hypothetical protein
MAGMQGGVSAQAFLLPLIIGISILAFILTAVISLSPTEAEIREDAALMARISGHHGRHGLSGHHGHHGHQPPQPETFPAIPPGYRPGGADGAGDDSGRWFRPSG